jgi:hypothetical protein
MQNPYESMGVTAPPPAPEAPSILKANNPREFIVNAVLILLVSLPIAIIFGLVLGLIPAAVIGGLAAVTDLAGFWVTAGAVCGLMAAVLFCALVCGACYPVKPKTLMMKPAPKPD